MRKFRKCKLNTALCAIALATLSVGSEAQQKAGLNCDPHNSSADKYEIIATDEKWGMRYNGQIAIPPEYSFLEVLDENLFSARTNTNESYGLLDENNKWICKPKKGKFRLNDPDYIVSFTTGFRRDAMIRAIAKANPSGNSYLFVYGVIDENCEYVILPEHLRLWYFMNNGSDILYFHQAYFS